MELRRPDPEGDFDEVLALVQECDRAVYGGSDWTVAELREEWDEIDLQSDAWVAEIHGRVAGLMQVYDHTDGLVDADGYVHPAWKGRGVGSRLLDAVQTRALDFASEVPEGGRLLVRTAHLVGDAGAQALFAARGYEHVRTFFRMTIDVGGALPEPLWPDGITVGPLDPETHGRALHEAYEQAFAEEWDHRTQPYDGWQKKVLEAPRFRLPLTVVAWEGGAIAGFALNYEKRLGDWGFVRSLGVVPGARRRGLGLALLLESFRRFAEAGETTVALGVDSQNPTGATRLYERAGMRELWRADVWEKEIARVREPGLRVPRLDDAAAVASVLNVESQQLRGRDDVTPAVIRGWWTQPLPFDLARDAVVATVNGAVVGYGDLGDQGNDGSVLWLDVRGDQPKLLLDELERRARARLAPGGVVRAVADDRNELLLGLLRDRGYVPMRAAYRMMIDLGDRHFEPDWPEHVTVRSAEREGDETLLHRLLQGAFADHWGFMPTPFEEWRHWLYEMGVPDPSLWFVVEVADEPAAAATCRPREHGDAECGWVSELGVLPAYRRRGIASALLMHAFASFRSRGLLRAGLGVDAENTAGAVRLYERVGMQVVERRETWELQA